MYQVKDKKELRKIIEEGIIPLDTIDVSNIRDMSQLFKAIHFINGSIADWDVSSVNNMVGMFRSSQLEQDLSKWNVSSVTDMSSMFGYSKFNGDISFWNTSKVTNMDAMFSESIFNQDISRWDISSAKNTSYMFSSSKFSKNLGAWDLSEKNIKVMFEDCPYSLEQYNIDREEYFKNIKLEKDNKNKIYLEEEKNKLDDQLNKEIDLTIIKMEF